MTTTKKKTRKPLIGRPTFNVKHVSAGNRELRIWFAWMDVANKFIGQRAVLIGLYHDALSFSREYPHVEKYVRRGQRLINKRWNEGLGETQECKVLEGHMRLHADHAYFVKSTSIRAAESLIYTIDSLIKYAGTAAHIGGKRDENLRGGRYLASNLTLLESFRVVANWQRHNIEWATGTFNPKNFNHVALKKLGLWQEENVPVDFLRILRRTSYFQLEQDVKGALEYLVCEIGMRKPTPEQAAIDRSYAITPPKRRRLKQSTH
ncbi:hypothetical protein EPN44_08935 [bacterium]|nr:MAG: hypothetical protein EPN44_08935 [bacterium]